MAAQIVNVMKYMMMFKEETMGQTKFKLLSNNATRYADWHNQRTIKRLIANIPHFDYNLPLEELTRELARNCYFGNPLQVPEVESIFEELEETQEPTETTADFPKGDQKTM